MAASGTGTASSGTPETENCSDIRLLLSALVDDEASPDEAARVKAHMASCADCASHFAFLRLTGQAFRQLPDVYPSASLSARIAAATYDKPTFAERIAGWLRPAPVRIGLGAALATGLAMVFIVPRTGEVDTATVSPVTAPAPVPAPAERGASVAKNRPGGEGGEKVAKPALPAKPANLSVASAPKAASANAKTSVASTLPSVKPPSAAVSVPTVPTAPIVPTARTPRPKTARVMVAKASPSQALSALTAASANLSASDVLRTTRTGPQMDRDRNLRSLSNDLKKPGTGNITLHRSGYDRAAETEGRLLPRNSVASAASAVPSSAAASDLSPLLGENAGGRLAEPNGAPRERPGSRLPAASAAAAPIAVAEAPTGTLRFRTNSRKTSDSESFSTAGLLNRGSGGLPGSLGRDAGFGSSPTVRTGIVDAPVTGLSR